MFSVMWSEHCSYKSSRVHLKTLPTEGPARAAGARARTPARSTSATAWPRSSRSSRTTTRRSSSRIRARRPAWAASSATSSPWARGRSRCSTRCASVRSTIRARAPHPRGRGRRHRRLRQQHRHPDRRRRDRVRRALRRQPAGQRVLPRHRDADEIVKGWRGRRQPGVLRRRQDRPRRHPRRDDGVGRVRREVGGEAAGGAGGRSVHGEAAARGVPRGDEDRRAGRHPGHGRGRADLLDVRDGRARRRRHGDRRDQGAAARDRHDAPTRSCSRNRRSACCWSSKKGREAEVERIFEKWDLHAVRIGEGHRPTGSCA